MAVKFDSEPSFWKRLFCCRCANDVDEPTERITSVDVLYGSVGKTKDTQGSGKKKGYTRLDTSRAPQYYQAPSISHLADQHIVTKRTTPKPSTLDRVRGTTVQPHADAIHRSLTKPTSMKKQASSQRLQRLESFLKQSGIKNPKISVSHPFSDTQFHVDVHYETRDGWSKHKAYLIPAEEIRQLGGTSLDLGANLKAHLRENFQSITIQ